MKTTVIREIAARLAAIINCDKSGNSGARANHMLVLRYIERELLPSGSGIDSGTQIDFDKSKPESVRLNTSFHHMDDGGTYDGWTEHTVTIRPSFVYGLDITISGRNRNDIKDYLAQTFDGALSAEIDPGEIWNHVSGEESRS